MGYLLRGPWAAETEIEFSEGGFWFPDGEAEALASALLWGAS